LSFPLSFQLKNWWKTNNIFHWGFSWKFWILQPVPRTRTLSKVTVARPILDRFAQTKSSFRIIFMISKSLSPPKCTRGSYRKHIQASFLSVWVVGGGDSTCLVHLRIFYTPVLEGRPMLRTT
jgi:hypothetical protein